MKSTYITYKAEHDPDSHFHVLSALDRHGNVIAVVSEATLEQAEGELIKLLLHLLSAEAAKGHDRLAEFPDMAPGGSHVVLSPSQLISIRLKLARAQANLRQSDMASLLGVTQQTYARMEGPGANPTLQTLAQIERALGKDLLGWV